MRIIVYTFAPCKYRCKDQRGRVSPLFMLIVFQVEEKVKQYVEEIILDQSDLFVVKVSLSGRKGNQILRVAMDGDEGITIKECARISRQLGIRIEEENLIEDRFQLEVSSSGLETPLLLERQYAKNLGRRLQVTKLSGGVVEGVLVAYDKAGLELEVNGENRKIVFKEIEKAIIMISFK